MTDKLRSQIERGLSLERLMSGADGYGLQDLILELHQDYVAQIVESKVDEVAAREGLYHRVNALADLRNLMTHRIALGRSASKQLEKG